MQFHTDAETDVMRITLRGELTLEHRGEFRKILTLLEQVSTTVDIGLQNLSHMDSAGAGMLLLARDHIEQQGQTVSFSDPPDHLRPLVQHLV
jgi:anti-anti-sigma factor